MKLAFAQQQHAVEQKRVRIARDIHDDLGVTLTQIAHRCELLKDELAQPERMRPHLTELSRSARSLSRSVDEIVWAVNPSNDTAEKFTSFMGQFVDNTVRAASLICRLALPDEMPAIAMPTVVRHKLFLIVKEALNTAIRHSGARTVRFFLRLDDRRLNLAVADDGCGFDPETAQSGRAGGGNGLSNMQKRAAAQGGKWRLESQPGVGTTVTVEVTL